MQTLTKYFFCIKGKLISNKLYKSIVRSHFGYGVVLWKPHWKKDVNAIKSVQRQATKLIPSINRLEYMDCLKELNLKTLKTRRLRVDLIQMFKKSKVLTK